jgi:serine/threonine protein kinase
MIGLSSEPTRKTSSSSVTDFMYLVMEYCNQDTLESLILNKRHEMSEQIVMKLSTQIVIALKFLQDKKISHDDKIQKHIVT